MGIDECVFCQIISDDPRQQIFYRDSDAVAFLDINPAGRGHALVVPQNHSTDIFAIDESSFAALGRSVHRVAQRLQDRLHPDGLTIFQCNREAGWQDVFHLHLHLVPRWLDDDLVRPWQASVAGLDLDELTESLR